MLCACRGCSPLRTEIADDSIGSVYRDETVSKPRTERHQSRREEGSAVAEEIPVKAGADPESIIVSSPAGTHPDGTAAIGKVVGENRRTRVDNLCVCDASVLPTAWGLPPILMIVAVAKRLGRMLAM